MSITVEFGLICLTIKQIIKSDESCDVSQGPILLPDVRDSMNNNCAIEFMFAHSNRRKTIGVLV